jgi:Uma2 family endonuclease
MSADSLPPAGPASHPSLGTLRRRDYDALPGSPRQELLRGRLHPIPSPTARHQLVAQLLWRHLEEIAETAGGIAFMAPLDVALADHSVVQPDVVYVSARRLGILRKRIEGAPDLLVEVLSPATARWDRGQKLGLYAACGVRECWLVAPGAQRLEVYVNEGGRFVATRPAAGVYRSTEISEIHLDLAAFWRLVAARWPEAAGLHRRP